MSSFNYFLSVKDFSGGENVITRKVKLNWTETKVSMSLFKLRIYQVIIDPIYSITRKSLRPFSEPS